jgi:DNA repair exonuclease SbcCD ATPase subunit
MFIESIKLKDWCQHSNVEWSEAESPVVGLLGENGKGKSNFLAALEYAFTGHVRGNANSYIRNGAKKAVVDVTFVKNGERGTIKRTINQNTTSRELKWANDDVITKDKEVRETLESIMGADTYGMQNAVFINQSELDSMLFGLQSEREALFVKLLLVSHLEKVGKVADGKMKVG